MKAIFATQKTKTIFKNTTARRITCGLCASVLLIPLFISCNQAPSQTEEKPEVVICFENYTPDQYEHNLSFYALSTPPVVYADTTGEYIDFIPNLDADTLVIPCQGEFAEVALAYRNFDYVYYPLLRGDTVRITTDTQAYPIVNSKHHPERNKLYNFYRDVRRGRTHKELDASTCLGTDFVRIANMIDIIRKNKWQNLMDAYCPLDSLHAMFNSYKQAYQDTIAAYQTRGLLSDARMERYRYYLSLQETEAYRMESQTYGGAEKDDTTYYHRLEAEISDKDAAYPAYREFLNHYLWYFNYRIKALSGNRTDWRLTFDEVAAKPLPPISKKLLLRQCMENINEQGTVDDQVKYLDRYVEQTGDTAYRKQTVALYQLDADADLLLLKDYSGKQTDFGKLMEKYKGKVVYVDFWASWCMPCRSQMKPAAQLREEYRGKDVAFVYLAVHDKEAEWQKAAQEEGLDKGESYFILNSKNSNLLNKLQVKLIPRYLLLDKNGKLVADNAPRPSDKRIRELIDRYLK